MIATHGATADGGSEGIEPCVKLQSAAVCLLNGKGKGVVAGVDTGAIQPGTPRLDGGLIDSIAVGAHLQDDGIQFKLYCLIEDGE